MTKYRLNEASSARSGYVIMSIDELDLENAIGRMTRRPYRATRLLPVDDMRFTNERILEELERRPLTEKELVQRFPDISYALKEILKLEVNAGNVLAHRQNGEEYYEITKKGKELVQFRVGRRLPRVKSP